MRTKYSVLMLSAVIAVLTPFAYRDAAATGNQLTPIVGCNVTGLANFTCAQFGAGPYARIDFLTATSSSCTVGGIIPPSGPTPCTLYTYQYTGATNNQVVMGIPELLTQKVNEAAEIGCGQYITNGSGDPTTGFGKGLTSLGVCRLPSNLSSTTFIIATDPSSPDTTKPSDWQVKLGNMTYAASLIGPVSKQPLIASTSETLTTKNGDLTYKSVAGQVSIVSGPSGSTILDPNTIFMCVPSLIGGGTLPAGWPIPPGYTCDVVYFVDKEPNIQIGPNSTCVKYIGRTPLTYAC